MKESVSSKKLWFTVFTVMTGFFFAILAATQYPNLEHMFPRFVDLLEFAVAAYVIGNVSNKYVLGKTKALAMPPPAKLEQSPDPLDREPSK